MIQLFRFGIVGSTAAIIHLSLVYLQVNFLLLPPLIANIFAFVCAFTVSYLGHHYWTFGQLTFSSISLRRFLFIAILGFILNEGLFYLLLNSFHLYYLLALFIVLTIIPPLTFVSSKFWAFKNSTI